MSIDSDIDALKSLGGQFLDWHLIRLSHYNNVKNKSRPIMMTLKFLTKHLDMDAMNIALLRNGSTIWLNEMTTSSQWKKLNSIHYRAQRTCLRDFQNIIPRQEATSRTKRAMKCSNCKMAIDLFLQREHLTRLGLKLQSIAYINERCPG